MYSVKQLKLDSPIQALDLKNVYYSIHIIFFLYVASFVMMMNEMEKRTKP